MIDASDIHSRYETHVNAYIALIEQFDEQFFQRKPEKGGWSLAQIMDHIAATTERCVSNALLCAEGKGERGKSGVGPAIFSMMGSFPPIKITVRKIPPGLNALYEPRQIKKGEAIDSLNRSIDRMQMALPIVQRASRSVRLKHWAGGWFNATQWLHSAEMHAKHHLRQVKRTLKQLESEPVNA